MRRSVLDRAIRARREVCAALLLLVGASLGAWPIEAQQTPPANQGSSSSSSAPAQSDDTSPYNPLPAEKDVEVATFYMRKGDPDAAIPRLEEAIRLKPNYAKPRLMLAEIYEKKNEKDTAVKYYREYLQVYPHAPDSKKVQEKIARLSKD